MSQPESRVRPPLAGARAPRGAALTGTGLAVPEGVLDNAAIAERLGVDEHWIERRTGTAVRHVVADGERLSDLAARAAPRRPTSAPPASAGCRGWRWPWGCSSPAAPRVRS